MNVKLKALLWTLATIFVAIFIVVLLMFISPVYVLAPIGVIVLYSVILVILDKKDKKDKNKHINKINK